LSATSSRLSTPSRGRGPGRTRSPGRTMSQIEYPPVPARPPRRIRQRAVDRPDAGKPSTVQGGRHGKDRSDRHRHDQHLRPR
jgi:hypothetical protein